MNIPSDSTGLAGYAPATPQQPCDTAAWSLLSGAPDSTCLEIVPVSANLFRTTEPASLAGDAGEPLPYRLAEDNIAVGLWLFGLIVLTASFLRMRSLIRAGWWQAVKVSDAEMPSLTLHWWDYFLTFLSCAVMITFAAYAVSGVGADTAAAPLPAWLIALIATAAILILLFLRLGMQSWVNSVFWKSDVVSQWRATFLLASAGMAILLFITGTASVYVPEAQPYIPYFLIATYGMFKIFILFSEIGIFSSAKTAFSHIILYICTLEMLPLFFIWKGIAFLTTSTILTDILQTAPS